MPAFNLPPELAARSVGGLFGLKAGSSVDQPDGGEVAPADQEILRAMSGAMRQIEGELTEGHEALTRERCPVLIGSRPLLRDGSGAGSGS